MVLSDSEREQARARADALQREQDTNLRNQILSGGQVASNVGVTTGMLARARQIREQLIQEGATGLPQIPVRAIETQRQQIISPTTRQAQGTMAQPGKIQVFQGGRRIAVGTGETTGAIQRRTGEIPVTLRSAPPTTEIPQQEFTRTPTTIAKIESAARARRAGERIGFIPSAPMTSALRPDLFVSLGQETIISRRPSALLRQPEQRVLTEKKDLFVSLGEETRISRQPGKFRREFIEQVKKIDAGRQPGKEPPATIPLALIRAGRELKKERVLEKPTDIELFFSPAADVTETALKKPFTTGAIIIGGMALSAAAPTAAAVVETAFVVAPGMGLVLDKIISKKTPSREQIITAAGETFLSGLPAATRTVSKLGARSARVQQIQVGGPAEQFAGRTGFGRQEVAEISEVRIKDVFGRRAEGVATTRAQIITAPPTKAGQPSIIVGRGITKELGAPSKTQKFFSISGLEAPVKDGKQVTLIRSILEGEARGAKKPRVSQQEIVAALITEPAIKPSPGVLEPFTQEVRVATGKKKISKQPISLGMDIRRMLPERITGIGGFIRERAGELPKKGIVGERFITPFIEIETPSGVKTLFLQRGFAKQETKPRKPLRPLRPLGKKAQFRISQIEPGQELIIQTRPETRPAPPGELFKSRRVFTTGVGETIAEQAARRKLITRVSAAERARAKITRPFIFGAGIARARQISLQELKVQAGQELLIRQPKAAAIPKLGVESLQITAPKVEIGTIQTTFPKLALEPRLGFDFPKFGRPGLPSPGPPRIPGGFFLPGIMLGFGQVGGMGRAAPGGAARKEPTRFRPTLAGLALGIKQEKIPKKLTGFEIRGIPTRQKKGKRRSPFPNIIKPSPPKKLKPGKSRFQIFKI